MLDYVERDQPANDVYPLVEQEAQRRSIDGVDVFEIFQAITELAIDEFLRSTTLDLVEVDHAYSKLVKKRRAPFSHSFATPNLVDQGRVEKRLGETAYSEALAQYLRRLLSEQIAAAEIIDRFTRDYPALAEGLNYFEIMSLIDELHRR